MRTYCIVLSRVVVGMALLLGFSASLHLANINSDLAVAGAILLFATTALTAFLWVKYAFPGAYGKVIKAVDKAFFAAMLCVFLSGCYRTIEPGHAGIKVEQTGGNKGVSQIPIETGRVFYNPVNEYVLDYPTNVQRAIWTESQSEGKKNEGGGLPNEEIAFQSSDQLHFTGDVAVAYQLVHEHVPAFYVQFRSDDIDTFTHGFFRDAVRKSIGLAAQHYTQEEINGGKQADLEAEAQASLTKAMESYGVRIIQLAFTSPPRPPATVKTAIEGKIAATQRAEQIENEKRQAVAEGQKTIALADAQAQANARINASITPQLIQWQQTKILGDKWDGHFSMVQGGQNPLMLALPNSK